MGGPRPDGHRFAAASDAVAHVFVDALDDECTVDGPDGHHLQRVRRLQAGERVTAADGTGSWREYEVTGADQGRIELRAATAAAVEPELTPALAVAFSLTKGEKPERVVQQLTELGVDRIVVLETRRSVARWDAEKVVAARGRLERVAREAAAQSRRARVPRIEALLTLADVAGHPGLVVGTPAGGPPGALGAPAGGEWLALVGPEGGLDGEERELLGGAPEVGVGPHVLRAETAAVALASVLTGLRRHP